MIPSWEGPIRAERVDAAIDALDGVLGPIVGPEPFDGDLVTRVHDPAYLDFLMTAWDRWLEAGHETDAAMGMCWPARRFGTVRPQGIDGQIGYHSFALDCSITAGTWSAVEASAATADTAARHVAGTGGAAFARCRPPGHHAMRDQFGGYCYLNNAAVAAERLILDLGAVSGGDPRCRLSPRQWHPGHLLRRATMSDLLFDPCRSSRRVPLLPRPSPTRRVKDAGEKARISTFHSPAGPSSKSLVRNSSTGPTHVDQVEVERGSCSWFHSESTPSSSTRSRASDSERSTSRDRRSRPRHQPSPSGPP